MKTHCAEILAVGTELLLGQIANTDAQLVSRGLSDIGINVYWHTVVGDNPKRLEEAVAAARRRADILITIGGLGPTCDDLTKQTLAACFGRELTFHPEIFEDIRTYYQETLHRPMPDNNRAQAQLPVGCTIFPNTCGTAPGCAFEEGGVHVLMLPGPPRECRAMFEQAALPYLRELSGQTIVSHEMRVFGLGESRVEELLRPLMLELTNPTLAPYALPSEMYLRLTAKADTHEEAEAMLRPLMDRVRTIVGDAVYGVDVSGLPEVCMQLLKERGLTFATAESCTGGMLGAAITDLPGSSAVYRGGVVSYWSEVKAQVLGVPQDLLDAYGAVSKPVARAMAEGAARLTGAPLALSTTGVAGPDRDERDNPVGTVYLALATPEGTFCRKTALGDRRDRVRAMAVGTAYDMLRRYLTGLPVEPKEERI